MIEAWFQLENGTRIPCLMPDEEIRELAALAGMEYSELFSVDIPAGASREGRVKCLVSATQMDTIYGQINGPFGEGSRSVRFMWRHLRTSVNNANDPTPHQIWVFPLPPRPLFVMPGSAGVFLIEAVDCRYFWHRMNPDSYIEGNTTTILQSDGREQRASSWDGPHETERSMGELRSQLPVGSFDLPGENADVDVYGQSNQHFTPDVSLAMTIDLMASQSNYMLQWLGMTPGNPSVPWFKLVPIGNDMVAINAYMLQNKVAVAGGFVTTSGASVSGPPNTVDQLLTIWQGGASAGVGNDRQANRIPGKVQVVSALHTNEAHTYYGNDWRSGDPLTENPEELHWEWFKDIWQDIPIPTYRARSIYGKLTRRTNDILPASRTVGSPSSPAMGVNSQNILTVSNQNGDPTGGGVALSEAIRLAQRYEVQYGRVAWGGWQYLPPGGFRATVYRFTLGVRNGQLVPVTITDAQEDDWILGPSGVLPNDPRDIVMSTGTIHAWRTGNGFVNIDSAPPMCRMFPARITESVAATSGNAWQWRYSFIEVSPANNNAPLTYNIGGYGRRSNMPGTGVNATNLCEEYNQVNVRIAPGVLQADFPMATIQALPIAAGVVVMMCEQFVQIQTGPDSAQYPEPVRRYWFSMPNAVRVICTPLVGDYNYGSFAVPAALYDDAGTFDAPTWTFDFGTF